MGCSSGGTSGSGPHAVAVQVAPIAPSIANGTAQQFTATLIYSDSTKIDVPSSVSWSTDNTAVATVNTAGLAQSHAVGNANITATHGNLTGSAALAVTAAVITDLEITPVTPSIAKGTA